MSRLPRLLMARRWALALTGCTAPPSARTVSAMVVDALTEAGVEHRLNSVAHDDADLARVADAVPYAASAAAAVRSPELDSPPTARDRA